MESNEIIEAKRKFRLKIEMKRLRDMVKMRAMRRLRPSTRLI